VTHGPLVDLAEVPPWMRTLVTATAELDSDLFRQASMYDPETARAAAVLILFGEDGPYDAAADGAASPDVLLLLRADGLGTHAGQVAFPGGATDDGDGGPVATALREATEETGLMPEGVHPVALLPRLYVPVSGFLVTPVVAHWRTPCPVRAVDPAETAAVARVPLAHLADPANRFRVRHASGFAGPAFAVPGMLVWGFTAALLSMVISLGGWERAWDADDVRDLDEAWRSSGVQRGAKGMSS
jgi:8-oxo-dGTP pyrophosphatase MutT (NUDIX family)